jgi:2,4'-dihydroxyacetophenone dioxygenase
VSKDQEGGLDQLLVPIYVDPDGNAVGVEDVFTKLEAARKHYETVGLGTDYVDRFIR